MERDTKPLSLQDDFPPPSLDEWRAAAERELRGADFDKRLLWRTADGITVKPIYTHADSEGLVHANGLPGFAPFVRGTSPLAGVSPRWLIRQDCTLAGPEDVNAALRDGLARGQTAIGLRLDMAARRGLDGDAAEAAELIGIGGCTLSSINGLRTALADVDLTAVPITIMAGTAALPLLVMLVALADERGVSRGALRGAVEGDPLGELAGEGRLRAPLEQHWRELAAMSAWCARECHGLRPVMVTSHVCHDAGASVTQELSCALATGAANLRALTEHGLDPNTAARSVSFSLSVSPNLHLEIAKLRAARPLWAKIVRAFGAESEEAQRMVLHVRTSAFTETVPDVHCNLVRSAIAAFAAAVGGCDSMDIAPFDEVIGTPSEFSRRLARNQQILLQEEAHLDKVVDPAGGSHVIEALTDAVGRGAWEFLQRIESEGGLARALQAGTVQTAIAETAAKRRRDVATRRTPIVGVSTYPDLKERSLERPPLERSAFNEERRQRLARLRSVRGNRRVGELIDKIRGSEGAALIDAAITAAREGATIGEITRALSEGHGEGPTAQALPRERASEPFERLRARAGDDPPRVLLVPMGPVAMRRARAEFCAGFFGAGGFVVEEPEAFESVDAAAKSVIESGAPVAVVCSDDDSYPEIVPPLIEKVKAARPEVQIIVAGRATDALTAAGVDAFVHLGADVIATLEALHARLKEAKR